MFYPLVAYAADHSKAVVLVILGLFGFVVFTTGRFVLSCLALCFRGFSILLSIGITSLGEERASIVITSLGEERAGLCFLVHSFVYVALVNFCPFSLPLGVGD